LAANTGANAVCSAAVNVVYPTDAGVIAVIALTNFCTLASLNILPLPLKVVG